MKTLSGMFWTICANLFISLVAIANPPVPTPTAVPTVPPTWKLKDFSQDYCIFHKAQIIVRLVAFEKYVKLKNGKIDISQLTPAEKNIWEILNTNNIDIVGDITNTTPSFMKKNCTRNMGSNYVMCNTPLGAGGKLFWPFDPIQHSGKALVTKISSFKSQASPKCGSQAPGPNGSTYIPDRKDKRLDPYNDKSVYTLSCSSDYDYYKDERDFTKLPTAKDANGQAIRFCYSADAREDSKRVKEKLKDGNGNSSGDMAWQANERVTRGYYPFEKE